MQIHSLGEQRGFRQRFKESEHKSEYCNCQRPEITEKK